MLDLRCFKIDITDCELIMKIIIQGCAKVTSHSLYSKFVKLCNICIVTIYVNIINIFETLYEEHETFYKNIFSLLLKEFKKSC